MHSAATRRLVLALVGSAVGLGAAATGCDTSDLIERLGQTRISEGTPSGPNAAPIPFTVFTDDVSDKASAERRVLFKSAASYQVYFGHAPPAAVSFPKEWAIFYAAGVESTGGFVASVASLSLVTVGTEPLLEAVTRLESPGPGCPATDAQTTPNVLVKFAAQPDIFNVDFARADGARDCGPPVVKDPCATVRCKAGTHCEAEQVQCVRAPCPPIAACVPDAAKVHCGGIAAIKCPGGGMCADDPSDSCDPAHGGADCGGLCSCVQRVLCVRGASFDSSPAICACVPKK